MGPIVDHEIETLPRAYLYRLIPQMETTGTHQIFHSDYSAETHRILKMTGQFRPRENFW